MVAVQLPQVMALARGVRPRITAAAQSVRNVFRNFVPAFVGRGVVQLSAYVDAWLASYLGNGAVSSFAYAQTIYVLPISLFGMAISAAELPTMARAVGTSVEISAYLRGRLSDGLNRIAYFIVPSVIALLALGDLIVLVLFQSGKFQRGNTIWVWQILIGSTVGLLASTMGRLYSSTFYALRDTRTPLRYAVVRVILTTLLGYLFALVLPGLLGLDRRLGAAGLTASAGIAGWVEFFLLRRGIDARVGRTRLVPSRMIRLWGAALAGAALPWVYKLAIDRGAPVVSTHAAAVHSKLVALVLLAIYGLTYLGMTAALNVPEAAHVIDRGKRLLKLTRRRSRTAPFAHGIITHAPRSRRRCIKASAPSRRARCVSLEGKGWDDPLCRQGKTSPLEGTKLLRQRPAGEHKDPAPRRPDRRPGDDRRAERGACPDPRSQPDQGVSPALQHRAA
jgi:putative peptidoglycan lipid II flippase